MYCRFNASGLNYTTDVESDSIYRAHGVPIYDDDRAQQKHTPAPRSLGDCIRVPGPGGPAYAPQVPSGYPRSCKRPRNDCHGDSGCGHKRPRARAASNPLATARPWWRGAPVPCGSPNRSARPECGIPHGWVDVDCYRKQLHVHIQALCCQVLFYLLDHLACAFVMLPVILLVLLAAVRHLQ